MRQAPRCLVDADFRAALEAGSLDPGRHHRHHLYKVLRLGPGDRVELVDGAGGRADAVCTEDRRLQLQRVHPVVPRTTAGVQLAVAPPRLPRLDWLVEKATELDVDVLTVLAAGRAQREISAARLERLRRKSDEALQQCRRLHRMAIEAGRSLESVLASVGHDPAGGAGVAGAVWLADPDAEAGPPAAPADAPLLLLVGPEGGFTDDEIAAARAAGARPVRLGPTVLRTETAALALAAIAALSR